MKIYLSGTQSRLYLYPPHWDTKKVYLAGEHPVKNGKDMKVYLAGENGKKTMIQESGLNGIDVSQINILESYYYLRKNTGFLRYIPMFGSFLLDSGAFTFLSGFHKENIDWDKYVEEYAEFVNRYDIKLFFELDIDSIIGLNEGERLRCKLEQLTNKKPIPVWHKSRGKDYFIKMCKEYPYVALGGIAIKEIPINIYKKAFPWFIQTAHKYRAKIHGLGYTNIADLHKYHFDSVDSTAWLYGNRGGYLYKFKPNTGLIEQIKTSTNQRLKSKVSALHNFKEWIKFSLYAEQSL